MAGSIQIDADRRTFLLQCGAFSYAFGVNGSGYLTHLHWGGRIDRLEDLPAPDDVLTYRHRDDRRGELCRQEYPGWGGEFTGEPALKADYPDGVRASLLRYEGYEEQTGGANEELVVALENSGFPLGVRLHYLLRGDVGVLERWSEVVNRGTDTVMLRSAMSASLSLPRIDRDYRLSHLCGRWGKESTIERQAVNQSKIVLESRTGLSGHMAAPFFALDDGSAGEHDGRVWFGALHWSGNWKMTVERDPWEQTVVCGGVNDFDFAWPLRPGEAFVTPVFSVGVSTEGFGGMSRTMHRYQRRHVLPPEPLRAPMPLIFNSWASMGAQVTEEKILGVAERAAEIGAELFVIDDGWQAALGDWSPDPAKFPRGLKPVIDRVRALGMGFGLWAEIESFEIGSRLHSAHPDWAMTFPGREVCHNRRDDVNRTNMLLNFAREDVAEHLYQAMRRLLLETGIRYLKLDMNCTFATPGWQEAPADERQTIWVRYVRNLYAVLARLRSEFPEVLMENCAAGGGRADLAMCRYFSRINRSDNQDTLDILRLHEGFTWVHPSRLAGGACHVSDETYSVNHRRVPMRFQAFAGMMGSLAVGKNLPACSPAELAEISGYVALYKRLRHIPHFGELYRLASHYDHPYAAFEFVAQDRREALLFVLGHSAQFSYKVPALRLKGLDPDAIYEVERFGEDPRDQSSARAAAYARVSGRGLMELGTRVELLGDYDAKILHFRAMKP